MNTRVFATQYAPQQVTHKARKSKREKLLLMLTLSFWTQFQMECMYTMVRLIHVSLPKIYVIF